MAQEQPQDNQAQISFLLSDFNTRLRDLEERNKIIRERVLLLGQNLISSKQETDNEISSLKKETNLIKKDIEKIKSLLNNLLSETDKFVRKDEIILIERMLKDFQPLEFVRLKDVEALINQKLANPAQTLEQPSRQQKNQTQIQNKSINNKI